jgi:hypothetical protein
VSKTSTVHRIVPSGDTNVNMEQISAEMEQHEAFAQQHYEQALLLQADADAMHKNGSAALWPMLHAIFRMQRAQVEQQAADLCRGKLNFMALGMILWLLDGEEGQAEEPQPGGMAS